MFKYGNDTTNGIYLNLFIFCIFMAIWLGGYFSQRRKYGDGDIAGSFAVAGYVTFGFTLFISFIPGLINISTLIVVIAVAIGGTLWLFFSRE